MDIEFGYLSVVLIDFLLLYCGCLLFGQVYVVIQDLVWSFSSVCSQQGLVMMCSTIVVRAILGVNLVICSFGELDIFHLKWWARWSLVASEHVAAATSC